MKKLKIVSATRVAGGAKQLLENLGLASRQTSLSRRWKADVELFKQKVRERMLRVAKAKLFMSAKTWLSKRVKKHKRAPTPFVWADSETESESEIQCTPVEKVVVFEPVQIAVAGGNNPPPPPRPRRHPRNRDDKPAIPKTAFKRVVDVIVNGRKQRAVSAMLQGIFEQRQIEDFEKIKLIAAHSGRKTIRKSDMDFFAMIRDK